VAMALEGHGLCFRQSGDGNWNAECAEHRSGCQRI
jgi:hypothetical protein